MLEYKVEQWSWVKEEIKPHIRQHYDELNLDNIFDNRHKLELDEDKLDALDSHGCVHLVTARKNSELVGYHCSMIDTLLMYKGVLAGISIAYWLKPSLRRGRMALMLFHHVEWSLKERGVQVLMEGTRLALNQTRFFEFLEYKPVEKRFVKII